MNIFALDSDPLAAARMHVDAHVVKMTVEMAQLLCTALRICSPSEVCLGLYRATHQNHPCARWVRRTRGNYLWALSLLDSLLREYDHRFPEGGPGKFRRVRGMLGPLFGGADRIPDGPVTPFAQAMPEEFRGSDPVVAYRRYYAVAKEHLHRWTGRKIPMGLKIPTA